VLLNIRGDETLGTRFDQLVRQLMRNANDACWSWPCHSGGGYASLHLDGRTVRAVMVAYELKHGPVPTGLQLDHLCRNTGCWNPDHVEPVTPSVNQLRGTSRQSEKTHCPQGHSYNSENTAIRRSKGGRLKRFCKPCQKQSTREYRQRLKGVHSAVDQ